MNISTVTVNSDNNSVINNSLSLTVEDIGYLELTVTDLYISSLMPNLHPKVTRKLCLKINSWRRAIDNPKRDIDLTVNAEEITQITFSIQLHIYNIPLTLIPERIRSHAMLKRFQNLDNVNILAA
jgi:hypothetical protein